MNSNRLTNVLWIFVVIGFVVAVFGIFMILESPDIGIWIMLIGVCVTIFALIVLSVQSVLATKVPWKTTLQFLCVFVSIIVAVIAIIVLDENVVHGIMLIIAALIGFLFIKKAIDKTACPKCSKKFSMKEISRETIHTFDTTMDVEHTIRNKKGEMTGSYTQTVPATKYIYKCIDECRFCGYQQEIQRQATYRK